MAMANSFPSLENRRATLRSNPFIVKTPLSSFFSLYRNLGSITIRPERFAHLSITFLHTILQNPLKARQRDAFWAWDPSWAFVKNEEITGQGVLTSL
jgi:hypothetical protein